MRAHEIITEASIFQPKYGEGSEFVVGDSASGKKLKTILANEVPDFDYINPVMKTNKKGEVITIGKGGNQISFEDSKGLVITLDGPKALGSAFNKLGGAGKTAAESVGNRGEIAEGILGAAMFAKFKKRYQGQSQAITIKDIQDVLSSMKKTGKEEYQAKVIGKGGTKDTIIFILKLKTVPYQNLLDPNKQQMLAKEFQSGMKFANSQHAHRYASYFVKNRKEDIIRVVSDGVSDESGTKIDVYVEVQSPKTADPRRTNLAISLKAGPVKQFGQVGGPSFESMETLFGAFGVDMSPIKKDFEAAKTVQEQLELAYWGAAEGMADALGDDNDTAEREFMREMMKGIVQFATGDDPQTRLLQFDKGDYEILDPGKLNRIVDQVDLTAVYQPAKGGAPQVFIKDVNSNLALIRIRAKSENKVDKDGVPYVYVRNIIEKEKLFTKLTRMQKR